MNGILVKTALSAMCIATTNAYSAKCMILSIEVNGKAQASQVFSESCGATPGSLLPYLGGTFFSANETLMPKPANGTKTTLKGKITIQLSWSAGKVYNTVELDQLTLTHAEKDPRFPNKTRWFIHRDELVRIRKESAERRQVEKQVDLLELWA
jgi:hypothetical protein